MLDLGNLPSHRGKKVKHGSSRPGVVKPSLPTSQPSVQIFDVDSSIPIEVTPAKTTAPTSAQPSQRVPMNLLENEDVAVCYDMSLKEFEHSTIHDLFKVCNYFSLVL